MHICLLADAPNPHTRKWATSLAGRGHRVSLISLRPFTIMGVETFQIGKAARWMRKLGYLCSAGEVARLVRTLEPDILHAHYATSYGLLGAWVRFHPFVVSTWGTEVMDTAWKSPAIRLLVRHNLSHADLVTATSRILTRQTRKLMKPGRPLLTVPFGVDLRNFSRTGRPVAEHQTYDLGTIKALRPTYGIEYLIEATALLKRGFPHISVLVAGEGSLRPKLERLCEERGLKGNISFVGFLPPEEVPSYLRRVRVFVVPSVLESFCVSALEASAMELPVVASRVGGLPEVVVDGATGILVPPRDPAALASAAESLLKDEERCLTMGRAGRRFVQENYDWESNVAAMEALYRKLLAGVRGWPGSPVEGPSSLEQ